MNLNRVILVGRLTQDPQIRTMPSGQSVASFGLATNRVWTDRQTNEKKQDTQFHNIVAFGRIADIASQYLSKGDMALIEGRIQTRSWEDTNGQRRYRTEIIAENLQLPPRSQQGPSAEPSPGIVPEEEVPVVTEEEVVSGSKKKQETEGKKQETGENKRQEAKGKQATRDKEEGIDVEEEIPF